MRPNFFFSPVSTSINPGKGQPPSPLSRVPAKLAWHRVTALPLIARIARAEDETVPSTRLLAKLAPVHLVFGSREYKALTGHAKVEAHRAERGQRV